MATKKPLPPDALVDYSNEGVPISRKMEDEAMPEKATPPINPNADDDQRRAHDKKRQGTEDAQKRSDTGTGI